MSGAALSGQGAVEPSFLDELEGAFGIDSEYLDVDPAELEPMAWGLLAALSPGIARPRFPTNIPSLDAALRGGLVAGSRTYLTGAPGAGKTALAVQLADQLEVAGCAVGWIAIDEAPRRIATRLAQMSGASRNAVEAGDAPTATLAALGRRSFAFFGQSHGLEPALLAAVRWARGLGRPCVIVVDSVTRARCNEVRGTPRERVEDAVAAITLVAARFDATVISTSEANRASWRDRRAAVDPRASASESSAVEFGAELLLVLADEGDQVRVAIAKNRDGERGEVWLRRDAERHLLLEVDEAAEQRTALALEERQVIDVLTGMGGFVASANALARFVKGKRQRRLATVKRLLDAGALVKAKDGLRLAVLGSPLVPEQAEPVPRVTSVPGSLPLEGNRTKGTGRRRPKVSAPASNGGAA